jgi:hypothetical protein
VDDSSSLCSRASLHWCANESGFADVSSIVPGLTVWAVLTRLWPGDGAPSLFPIPVERGQGFPQPQPGKWHRPSAVTQKRHQQRPKGEAAKQRASEQPVFTNLNFERVCMKMWCFLDRDPANKCREYDRCGVAFPWPMVSKIFLGKRLGGFLPQRMLKKKYYLQPALSSALRGLTPWKQF